MKKIVRYEYDDGEINRNITDSWLCDWFRITGSVEKETVINMVTIITRCEKQTVSPSSLPINLYLTRVMHHHLCHSLTKFWRSQ